MFYLLFVTLHFYGRVAFLELNLCAKFEGAESV
jgi:hypothetical protein